MLKCFLITVELWGVGRFLPALIQGIIPSDNILSYTTLRIILFSLVLPVAWLLAKKISNGMHRTCVKVNMIIFFIIEGSSIFQLLSYSLDSYYYASSFGIGISDFQGFIALGIMFAVGYCGTVIWMIKSTPSVADENEADLMQENIGVLIPQTETIANETAKNTDDEITCEIARSPEEPSSSATVSDTDDSIEIEYPRLRFCRKCGFELFSNSAFCSKCGTPIAPPIPKCSACGKLLTDESVFCHYCGKKVHHQK